MDGSRVLCWGWNRHGQAPNPDAIQGPFVAISAGIRHSLAIRVDGSVACWGDNSNQQAPSRDVRGPFVGVAAGDRHSCAIRVDGSVACWGDNSRGQAPRVRIFPAPGGAAAVCCAAGVSLAVRPDGGVTPWGDPTYRPPEDVLVLRLNRPTVPASSGSAVASSSYAAPAVSYLVL
uniref:Uncharacterized protein n=1 Tax=Pycnococcus provasolii TaxID=41880 RepID=A0A7S2F0U0_9CHLO|mmetsp:Transcript_10793/g.24372  ORF Transcript_10793/g.24372 Transcript_10793/m.24372 type:complete len:175 (+) Transcript_10793:303-827(+)